jgi:hypothetical protein
MIQIIKYPGQRIVENCGRFVKAYLLSRQI